MRSDLLVCPYCAEDDFDLIGLKTHLEVWCDEYKKIPLAKSLCAPPQAVTTPKAGMPTAAPAGLPEPFALYCGTRYDPPRSKEMFGYIYGDDKGQKQKLFTEEQMRSYASTYAAQKDAEVAELNVCAGERIAEALKMVERYDAMEDRAEAAESRLAAMEANARRWISVSERLPANDWTQVWAYGTDRDGTHQWAAVSNAFQDPNWMKIFGVTHWQPLPAHPRRQNTLMAVKP